MRLGAALLPGSVMEEAHLAKPPVICVESACAEMKRYLGGVWKERLWANSVEAQA